MTIWSDKNSKEKSCKLFREEIFKKLKAGAKVKISGGIINEMQISKDLDLSNFMLTRFPFV